MLAFLFVHTPDFFFFFTRSCRVILFVSSSANLSQATADYIS